jgi:hypothetical protein
MKSAMRAKNMEELGVIRLLLAAIKQREIDERITLDDNQIIAVIDKMIRQCNDSIEQFKKFDRRDLASKEEAEVEILKKYMPKALTEDEINDIIKEAIANNQAASIKDMGRVMAEVKSKAQGRADIGKISAKVKDLLGQ